jgi:predicted GIY-YIG superfamily endonuclease
MHCGETNNVARRVQQHDSLQGPGVTAQPDLVARLHGGLQRQNRTPVIRSQMETEQSAKKEHAIDQRRLR